MQYIKDMNIASLSTALSQISVQQEAAVEVQKLAMNTVEQQGVALTEMMSQTIADPTLAIKVDLLA